MGIRHIFLSCTPRIDVLTTNASSRNVCRFGKRLAERIARRGIGRRNNPEAYGQGWDAYGGRFGASLARSASSNFFGDFVFASIFSQDPRFFPESKPTFWGSVKYSAERIVITRNDPGKDVFNTSGLLGPLSGEALANVCLPQSEQTVGKTAERYAIDLAWQIGGNMFRNYWPTFFKRMGLNRLKVIPNPGESGAPTK